MADLKRKYKKNKDFVFRKIGNETILVPIKNNVGDMGCIYTLNEVGAFICEHLDGKNRPLDVRNLILEEFEVPPEQAEEDLGELVDDLKKIGAISQME